MKRSQHIQNKRDEADARQEAYDKLSLKEKYERAIVRGHWRTREAKRLRVQLKAA